MFFGTDAPFRLLSSAAMRRSVPPEGTDQAPPKWYARVFQARNLVVCDVRWQVGGE